jgi:hypothetical protein
MEEYEQRALVAERIKIGSADQRKKIGSLNVSKVGGVDVACQAPRGVVMARFYITLHLYIFYGILNGIWYSGTKFQLRKISQAAGSKKRWVMEPLIGERFLLISRKKESNRS